MRDTGNDGHSCLADIQAAFDFLPAEIRHCLRFGTAAMAARATLVAWSHALDRQAVDLGSRIAAARRRDLAYPADAPGMAADMGTQIPVAPEMCPPPRLPVVQELLQQRDVLRSTGATVLSFRDGRSHDGLI